MQIISIDEIASNRVRISLDNNFSFVIYKGEVRLYKLKEGEEISPKAYDEIINTILPKRATARAMNLLKVRPYTVKGLRDKLIAGEYPDNAIETAIEYVSSYHYLDDYQYALDYIDTYKDRKNKLKLKSDLYSKGVDKNLIEQVLEEAFCDDENDYDEVQILSYLRKKHYDPENTSYEEKVKMLSYLCRKGYSVEQCRRVLDIT